MFLKVCSIDVVWRGCHELCVPFLTDLQDVWCKINPHSEFWKRSCPFQSCVENIFRAKKIEFFMF